MHRFKVYGEAVTAVASHQQVAQSHRSQHSEITTELQHSKCCNLCKNYKNTIIWNKCNEDILQSISFNENRRGHSEITAV